MHVDSVDTLSEVTRVLHLEGQAILGCAERLKESSRATSLTGAIQALQSALAAGGKIVVTGLGKSGKVAQKIAATLSSTGSLAVYLHPTEGLHGDLGIVSSKDAVLALSYTGNTDELVRLVPSLKAKKVPLIGLGGNPASRLAEACDFWLDGAVEQEACPHNLAPTSSTTLALALGDAIAMALMRLRGFDARAFAQNHPGGSLGRRLNLTVDDIMHRADAVATVAASASMDEVIVAATEKKLGGVLVIDGDRLIGLITDGDLRRALQHRERFFLLRAAEVMTRDPISAKSGMMAHDALALMENRPSQISVLPVVNPQGAWMGLVRLHDLIRSF